MVVFSKSDEGQWDGKAGLMNNATFMIPFYPHSHLKNNNNLKKKHKNKTNPTQTKEVFLSSCLGEKFPGAVCSTRRGATTLVLFLVSVKELLLSVVVSCITKLKDKF